MVLATAFCVNLRFIVFSAHLRPYVMHQPLRRRLLSGYVMADLNYVLFTQRFPPAADTAGDRRPGCVLAGNCYRLDELGRASLLGIALANSIPLSWGSASPASWRCSASSALSSRRRCAPGRRGRGRCCRRGLRAAARLNILFAIAAAVAAG